MKTIRVLITTAVMLAFSTAVWATNVDTGWKKYTQPNGVTFIGREWGDEFEYFWETQDGYRFVKNYNDGYYYYARLNAAGDYSPSQFKVAIDAPRGITKQLERSAERNAFIAQQRAQFEASLAAVQAGSPEQPLMATYTLKLLLVEFQDFRHRNPSQDGRSEYTFQNFENLFFSFGTYNTTSPDGESVFGSVRDFYYQMSDGDLTITGYVLNNDNNNDGVPDWVLLDYNKADYQNYTRYLYTDALDKAAQENPPLDTSTGTFTKLVVIYAGNWWLGGGLHPAAQQSLNRYRMSERLFYNSANQDPTNAPFSHIGIHCHEFGHLLGFDDLYTGGNDHIWSLMNVGHKNGPTGVGGRTCSAPAPLNPEYRRRQGWIATHIIDGAPQTFQADYSLQDPEVFQINDPHTNYYFLIENRHFQDGDFNSWLPYAYPSFVSSQGILTWRISSQTANPVFIPADNDFHQAPDGTPSQGDHGDFFPGGTYNLLFSPWSTPSSWPSDDDVAFEIISDNGTSFTVDFYSFNAVDASPAKPQDLTASPVPGPGYEYFKAYLTWTANSEPDLSGYEIFREINKNGAEYENWKYIDFINSTSYTDETMPFLIGGVYDIYYKIRARDTDDNTSTFSNTDSIEHVTIIPKRATTQNNESVPLTHELKSNYPNPFNASTTISFNIPDDNMVELLVYDVQGREVAKLVNERLLKGTYSVKFYGDNLSSGLYFYKLSTSEFSDIKRMLLIK